MNKNTSFLGTSPRLLGVGLIAIAILVLGMPLLALADTLNRQLQVGMRGTDVSALQTFLAADPTLYPQGLVTGYFGFLTKSAVSNFQARNGISAVGRVGPITLPVLNAQMAGGVSGGDVSAPVISSTNVSIGNNSANVTWNTNESARGTVYYSTAPLSTYEFAKSVNVSGSVAQTDASLRSSQSVAISGLQRNTTYHYLVYSTDASGNVSITWPATFQTN